MVDRLLCDGVDIFAMGQLHHWLELNAIVLCGREAAVRSRHHRLIEATEAHFYEQPDGGIRDIMDWYALNRGKSVWRRAAGVYIRTLSEPQLFVEGNHRTGALADVLSARARRPRAVRSHREERARVFQSLVRVQEDQQAQRRDAPQDAGTNERICGVSQASSEQGVSRIDRILASADGVMARRLNQVSQEAMQQGHEEVTFLWHGSISNGCRWSTHARSSPSTAIASRGSFLPVTAKAGL